MASPRPTGAPSPQVLQWLHRVIAPEYIDPQRTYADVATTLEAIPTLSPRTSVYTHENGSSELLLHVFGLLPAIFRGSDFNVPVSIWIPHHYPRAAPMVFVTPPKEMAIRAGNHVDPSGKCYHPYLANWINYYDRSNIKDLCDVLRGIFSREPPVVERQSAPTPQPQNIAPPPRPPLPAELGPRSPRIQDTPKPQGPPPVPPLPKELANDRHGPPERSRSISSQHHYTATPPPIPPHPNQQQSRPTPPPTGFAPNGHHYSGPPGPPHQWDMSPAPPSPHLASRGPLPPNHPQAVRPPMNSPQSHYQGPGYNPQQPPIPHPHPQAQPRYQSPPLNQRPQSFHAIHPPAQHPGPIQQGSPAPPAQPKPRPIVDLLDAAIEYLPPPSPVQNAPPPPPNPEKDRVIHQISLALHQRAEATAARAQEGLQSAAAMREAMKQAESAMERERTELNRLAEICDKDTEILHERIAMAERVIEDARRVEPPNVDEAVVAPSVVHSQLYDLVTEDMAIEDTIYVLGKALDREKIPLEVFLKHVRNLAREQFLKRALVKKILEQLGMQDGSGY
ncbi:tumor susceptibility protein [Geopyxis carbonaria]|nr:tumor susceptibility protein [Geopyxis carbonaria]